MLTYNLLATAYFMYLGIGWSEKPVVSRRWHFWAAFTMARSTVRLIFALVIIALSSWHYQSRLLPCGRMRAKMARSSSW